MPQITLSQSDFSAGLNRLLSQAKVAQSGNSYYLGINIRARDGELSNIQKPLNLSDQIPAGKMQGIYAANNLVLVIKDGQCWVKDISKSSTNFVLIPGIQLDDEIDNIYAEFVPGSTLGFARTLIPTSDGSNDISLDIAKEIPFNSSIQGVIIQDGINQGILLKDDGSFKVLNNYGQWKLEDREYVPIGKQMLYASGILFIISPDGKQIYRSVTGRPIDCMVAVDYDGDKTSSSEQEGGAPSVSHRVDFRPITSITSAGSDGVIIITTLDRTFLVTLDFDNTIFSEPLFINNPLFANGAMNQFCIQEINGDIAYIGQHGIYSFNTSSALKLESNNDIFSGQIANLFEGMVQTTPCTISHEDYVFFAVNTVLGPGVLVYDKIYKKFVSLDLYEGIGQIKQFALAKNNGIRQLFFITEDNHLYEWGGSDEVETSQLLVGEWTTGDARIEQKPKSLEVVFNNVEEPGAVTITPIVDRFEHLSRSSLLKAQEQVQNVPFNLNYLRAGYSVGIKISWSVKAKLCLLSYQSESLISVVSQESRGRQHA